MDAKSWGALIVVILELIVALINKGNKNKEFNNPRHGGEDTGFGAPQIKPNTHTNKINLKKVGQIIIRLIVFGLLTGLLVYIIIVADDKANIIYDNLNRSNSVYMDYIVLYLVITTALIYSAILFIFVNKFSSSSLWGFLSFLASLYFMYRINYYGRKIYSFYYDYSNETRQLINGIVLEWYIVLFALSAGIVVFLFFLYRSMQELFANGKN